MSDTFLSLKNLFEQTHIASLSSASQRSAAIKGCGRRRTRRCASGILWADARLVAFRDERGELMSDEDVAQEMQRDLATHLAQLDNDDSVHSVLAVTHHLAFEAAVRRTGSLRWEFFNAFMGSAGLGEVIAGAQKVRAALYGHTHVIGDYDVDGLRVYGTPLGYPRERKGLDEDDILETRIGWIEL